MSNLTLSREEIERRSSEESPLGLLAEGLKPSLYRLADELGRARYSVHVLYTGEYFVGRKLPHDESLSDITDLVNGVAKSKASETKDKVIGGLKRDIEYIDIVGADRLVNNSFYNFHLNRLNGSRQETVKELNAMLDMYGVSRKYRFK